MNWQLPMSIRLILTTLSPMRKQSRVDHWSIILIEKLYYAFIEDQKRKGWEDIRFLAVWSGYDSFTFFLTVFFSWFLDRYDLESFDFDLFLEEPKILLDFDFCLRLIEELIFLSGVSITLNSLTDSFEWRLISRLNN